VWQCCCGGMQAAAHGTAVPSAVRSYLFRPLYRLFLVECRLLTLADHRGARWLFARRFVAQPGNHARPLLSLFIVSLRILEA
jgi:hypothetical protein